MLNVVFLSFPNSRSSIFSVLVRSHVGLLVMFSFLELYGDFMTLCFCPRN